MAPSPPPSPVLLPGLHSWVPTPEISVSTLPRLLSASTRDEELATLWARPLSAQVILRVCHTAAAFRNAPHCKATLQLSLTIAELTCLELAFPDLSVLEPRFSVL